MTTTDPWMAMKIVHTLPPNFREIVYMFPASRGRGVIFTYGDVIHNPSRIAVSDALMRHEWVHAEQQRQDGPVLWWDKYLVDPQFRFEQELPAHRAEWEYWRGVIKQGRYLDKRLMEIATRLSSSLYGRIVSYEEAKKMVLA